jgi:endoglucanase
MNDPPAFLARLLDAAAPSGFEVDAARLWRAEAETFADSVTTDVNGNTLATVNPDGRPRVMLAGHIDEIGLQVTHIDEEGFLYVAGIGGWDPQVLVGQRVRILGPHGGIPGVVGKKAIHLQKVEERRRASRIDQLWVDVGVESRAEAAELGLRVGDAMVIDAAMISLAGDRIASRAIDNRIGAYVVLEALRLLSDMSPVASAVAVATVQEEIGGGAGGGARTSASAWNRTPPSWSTSRSAPMYPTSRRSYWGSTVWEEAPS